MDFGARHIEAGEPVLYFDDINMALLSEQNKVIAARGGWLNMPRVTWTDRTEVMFQMSEGVMSSIEMSILLSANVTDESKEQPLYVHRREGPSELQELVIDGKAERGFYVKDKPYIDQMHKAFIFEYRRDAIQRKIFGKIIEREVNGKKLYFISVYQDRDLTIPGDLDRLYVIDYYYEYGDEALIYTMYKERFNGLFTLEGKFYSKDENDGFDYTNILYMPKVRIVSDINLRLGERADPAVSTFNILGLPETIGNKENVIVEITRLGQDIDGEI